MIISCHFSHSVLYRGHLASHFISLQLYCSKHFISLYREEQGGGAGKREFTHAFALGKTVNNNPTARLVTPMTPSTSGTRDAAFVLAWAKDTLKSPKL